MIKQTSLLLLLLLLSYGISGCGESSHSGVTTRAESSNDIVNDTVPPNARAFEMMNAGEPFEKYMPVQMEAVSQLRDGNPRTDAILILSQTGHFLIRHGDYVEALEYLQEASDSAKMRLREGMSDNSTIRLQGELAFLYDRFGLFDEAIEEITEAIRTSGFNQSGLDVDVWRMKGALFSDFMKSSGNKKEMGDSVLYCIAKAMSLIPQADPGKRELHDAKCNFDKAALFIENPDIYPDSIPKAIELLDIKDASGSLASSVDVLLGRAYVLSGRDNEGISLMERGLEECRRQNWNEGTEWALDLLAASYAETGRGRQLAAIYPELKAAEDELMTRTKMNALVGAEFKYRLREKQHQIEDLKEKNKLSLKIILICFAILAIGIIAGFFFTRTYIRLKTRSREENTIHQKEISDILSRQTSLNKEIEQLNEQLQKNEDDAVINNVTEQLDPALLSGEDETKFRKAFMKLHPQFLKRLRAEYPALTSSDELLCMLICLKVPPIDMAASLGITRASLNSARYRLRKRLNLDKDTDLDSFIQSK